MLNLTNFYIFGRFLVVNLRQVEGIAVGCFKRVMFYWILQSLECGWSFFRLVGNCH